MIPPLFYNTLLLLKRLEESINGLCSVYFSLTGSQNQLKITVNWSEGFRCQYVLDQVELGAMDGEEIVIEHLITVFNSAYRKEIEKRRPPKWTPEEVKEIAEILKPYFFNEDGSLKENSQ